MAVCKNRQTGKIIHTLHILYVNSSVEASGFAKTDKQVKLYTHYICYIDLLQTLAGIMYRCVLIILQRALAQVNTCPLWPTHTLDLMTGQGEMLTAYSNFPEPFSSSYWQLYCGQGGGAMVTDLRLSRAAVLLTSREANLLQAAPSFQTMYCS